MGRRLAAGVGLLLVALAVAPPAGAQDSAVRAVLFYSPTCDHCEYLINELLLPVWFPQYGGEPVWHYDDSVGAEPAFYLVTNGTLEVLLVDVSVDEGLQLYATAGEAYAIPPDRQGVPRVIVGDRYLVGETEVTAEFPGIVEAGLHDAGGIDWPDLPGLADILASLPGAETTTTTTTAAGATTTALGSTTTAPATPTTTEAAPSFGGDSPWDRFQRDPAANSLALVVLALMLASLLGVALLARREGEHGPPGVAVPLFGLAGLGVAVYLAFVEASGSEAVCGPLGDCNTVQQSDWARVLGVPVGVIGVVGYAVVLIAWAVARFVAGRVADWARMALFAGAAVGTGFSLYLTFLEPFVIGATCMWCLSSAVIVTALLWVTVLPAMAAWDRLRSAG